MTHKDVIAALGGYRAVAAALGKAPAAVLYWQRRRIPGCYWPDIASLAARKGVAGITPDSLKRMLEDAP